MSSADCRNQGRPPVFSHMHNGRSLWRSSELKTQYDNENLADDIMLLEKLTKENEKLIIYTAREENGDTSKQGNENLKIYKPAEKKYYNLSSKMKV